MGFDEQLYVKKYGETLTRLAEICGELGAQNDLAGLLWVGRACESALNGGLAVIRSQMVDNEQTSTLNVAAQVSPNKMNRPPTSGGD